MGNAVRFHTLRSSSAEAAISLRKHRTWYAPEGDGTTPPPPPTETPPAQNGGNGGSSEPKKLTFTQEELDKIINERLGRAEESTLKKLLAKHEVPDEDTLANLVKASKEAEVNKLSAVEKAEKAKADAEAKVKLLEDQVKAEREERRRDLLHNAVSVAARDARARDAGDVLMWLQTNHADELAKAISDENKVDPKAVALLIGKAKEAKPYYFEGGRTGAGPGSPSNAGGGTPTPDEKAKQNASRHNRRLIRG